MLGLIVKTLMRALLIFLPVVYLTLPKEALTESSNTNLLASLSLMCILIIMMFWIKRRKTEKRNKLRHAKGISHGIKQNS